MTDEQIIYIDCNIQTMYLLIDKDDFVYINQSSIYTYM